MKKPKLISLSKLSRFILLANFGLLIGTILVKPLLQNIRLTEYILMLMEKIHFQRITKVKRTTLLLCPIDSANKIKQ
jgi:hypothetical protein